MAGRCGWITVLPVRAPESLPNHNTRGGPVERWRGLIGACLIDESTTCGLCNPEGMDGYIPPQYENM